MAALETGTELLNRFTLNESLRPGLWLATDRELDSTSLIEVYETANTDLDALRQLVRKFREVQHPALARVFDLHHDDTHAVIPLSSGSNTTLLSKHLAETGPLPYREVLEKVRPLVEGLRAAHDQGVIHSSIRTDHIITAPDGQWILLPGAPARDSLSSEMQQLGNLLSDALTGGAELNAGREPNDVPDKLFGGRTVPALLNQLVIDMRSPSSSQRPAGMGEALNRLNQIDSLASADQPAHEEDIPVFRAPAADNGTIPLAQAKRTPPPSRINAAVIFLCCLAAMVAIGAAGLFWYYQHEHKKVEDEQERRLRAQGNQTSNEVAQPEGTGTPTTTQTENQGTNASTTKIESTEEVDLIKRALAKAEADEAQDLYVEAKRGAENIGAHKWAAKDFGSAIRSAGIADQAFIDKDYGKSAENYLKSAEKLVALSAGKEAKLEELLDEGALQLVDGTSATATAAYSLALMIDPKHPEALEGKRRAVNVDKRNAFIRSAEKHEEDKRFAFAYTDYEEAAKLDPDSDEALAGQQRLKDLISEDRFQAMMSAGLTAYHQGDFEQATKTLNDAKIFEPTRPEVDEALELVAEGKRLRKIEAHKQRAATLEKAEDWQAARKEYLATLEIDPNLQFANEGRSRTEARISLQKKLDHYNATPSLLLKPTGLQDAQLVLADAQVIPAKGPKLQKAQDLLQRTVNRAATKVAVTITSDNQTEVDFYKVGKFGQFETKQLELRPGNYTVVGHRNGFKDVRKKLVIEPGQTEANISIICTERF